MLSDFTGAEKVYIACGYTDLRKGIDGLATLVQSQFQLDPFTNTLFLFCGRRKDRIKALYWEGNGFVLLSLGEWFQPVEKPGHASSVNRFFRIYGQDQEEGKGRNSVLPQPSGQLFQIHGSKFKLHPVCNLGQASVLSIAHGMFFLGVGKDSFNGFFPLLV